MTDQEFNREFFVEAGRRGGEKIKKKYPKDHFTKLVKLRWKKQKAKEKKK